LPTSTGLKQRGNIRNQLFFAEQLEDIYGTQAITGLRGQTERAVRGVTALTQALRDPIRGIGNIAGDAVDFLAGQRPEDRVRFIREIVQ